MRWNARSRERWSDLKSALAHRRSAKSWQAWARARAIAVADESVFADAHEAVSDAPAFVGLERGHAGAAHAFITEWAIAIDAATQGALRLARAARARHAARAGGVTPTATQAPTAAIGRRTRHFTPARRTQCQRRNNGQRALQPCELCFHVVPDKHCACVERIGVRRRGA
jgi:hypothetical protein